MKNTVVRFFLFSILFTNFTSGPLFSQKSVPTGMLKGKLVDADTKAPLVGANVVVLNSILGAATDMDGVFIIPDVPVGSYALQFIYIGYTTITRTDVIVRPKRITYLELELQISPIESQEVVVTGSYFEKRDEHPLSITNFSREEIRRSPGSAGDVSRIMMVLPSIAKVNDQSNSLIVRGGSPIENSFYIDNIEVPNINHFPTQGASGGPIGLINVDFIEDVNFSTGGFPATYGDKLSSIMEISFREGNRDEYDGQLDLNFAGFGGNIEGPLFDRKGSFLLSARRSYLDLLINAADIGTSVAPRYGDIQGKIVFDLSPRHRLTGLGIFGDDHNNPDKKAAIENDMIVYGNQDIYESTSGVNWRALWNSSGYSNTSLAYTSSKFKEDYFETNSDIHLLQNRSLEQVYKLRNLNHFRLNKTYTLEFGIEAKHLISSYNNFFAEYTDALGDAVPAFQFNGHVTANKFGTFVNLISKPFNQLTTTVGLRADYFSLNENSHISPRFSFSYRLTERTTLNGSYGLFYQNLPMIVLYQNEVNQKLKDPSATHYVLGIDQLLTKNTKLTLEIYRKEYRNFPIDVAQPALFLIDELFYRYGFFFNHGPLIDTGKASAQGVEIMVQKKLAKNIYGLASASYFRTRYQGGDNIWRDRVFDNRVILSLEGGYKPNRKWEFSLRWIYAGGPPYTPFNLAASQRLNRAVLDGNQINAAHYPDYHSMNIRADRRFSFSKTNLVAYFSVWNAYNRKNVATYFWNENENKQTVSYQWSMLPIIGLEFEF
jgi:hypothetical protein